MSKYKRIGFLSNKLTIRGTEVVLYDYAEYSEKILHHKSFIITRPYDLVSQISPKDVSKSVYDKFERKFPVLYYKEPDDIRRIVKENKLDILFIEKAGSPTDGLNFPEIKTIIHGVFSTYEPHGSIYTAISPFLNKINKTSCPVLPYMVKVHDTNENIRDELNIPKDAIVYGCYCGADEYTDEDVKRAIISIGNDPIYSKIYFIFMNIIPFCPPCDRIIFAEGSSDLKIKRMFINTCDAMIYGRTGGETFGLACGEFSLCNKPIIARKDIRCHAHQDILGDAMIPFQSYDEVYTILTNWDKYKKDVSGNGYHEYTPEKVIQIFQKFIDIL